MIMLKLTAGNTPYIIQYYSKLTSYKLNACHSIESRYHRKRRKNNCITFRFFIGKGSAPIE